MQAKVKLQKYVDKLPIPKTISPVKRDKKGSYYEVTMREFTKKVHRDLGPTRLWGYNGMYPGLTFDAIKGETTYVKWMSDLPTKHFLPIDTTIHGADKTLPEVRTVVHLHGGKQPASSDGYPEVGLREILNKRDLCLKEKYMSTRTLKPLPYGIMIIQWELRD